MPSYCERDSAQHPILFRQHIQKAHTGSCMQDVVWHIAGGLHSHHSFPAMQATVLLDMHSLLLGYALFVVRRKAKAAAHTQPQCSACQDIPEEGTRLLCAAGRDAAARPLQSWSSSAH